MHGRPRSFNSVRNGLFGLLMALAGCGASGDGRLAIVVRLDGVTPQLTGLEVSAALNGKLASNTSMQITADLTEFVVYLPAQTEGTLDLDIGALQDPLPCQPARAQLHTMVHPAPPRVIELRTTLQPAAPPLCPLIVNLIGDGAVQASSGSLFCNSSQCRGLFPQNQPVTLNAVPGARSSSQVAWSPLCPTPGPTCTVTLAQKLQLSATFSTLPCSPASWCQHSVPVNGSNLRGVWSGGPSDVWVVGTNSVVAHYDGKRWTPVTVAPSANFTFYSVASTGPSDVVIVGSETSGTNTIGSIFSFNGSKWTAAPSPGRTVRDVWLGSASSGRAVGDAGLLYARSGSTWSGLDSTVTGKVFWSVWSSGSAEYIVGTSGFIGVGSPGTTTVQPVTSPPTSNSLFSVWGTGGTDIWAVGFMGTLVHYDGAWTASPQSGTLTQTQLNGVWGSAPNDYWAVGDNATLLHYDGTTWSMVPGTGGGTLSYRAIAGSSAADVWLVGDGGTVLQHTQ